MKIILGFFLVLSSFIYAQETSGSLAREKREIMALKQELNQFYNIKEEEYQKQKQDLEQLLRQIQNERNQIQRIRDDNQKILANIKGEVDSKTAKIFNAMKPKDAALIFDNMIAGGKIEDVFDIILKLKEPKVTSILKFLNIRNSSRLTEKLLNFRVEEQTQKDNNG